jgi:two-component system NtrC family sensor kinase
MNTLEFSKLKKQLELINNTVSGDLYNLGDLFFEKIVSRLNEALGADYTFIGELSKDHSEIQTISLVNKNGILDNFVYELKDTPCENVIGRAACSYAKDITKLFPKDQLLIDMGIKAYVGVPLYNSKKEPTGILVCLYENEIDDTFGIESILLIFASKASAELEHLKLYDALQKSKKELEIKVEERTKLLNLKNSELELTNQKLSQSIQNLKTTQSKLVHSEKMASLGILTSGVAHEINNPLNYIKGAYFGLMNYFNSHSSNEKEKTDSLLKILNEGVDRIANIVTSLSLFSRDNDSMDEVCDIHIALNNSLTMLENKIKHKVAVVKMYCSEKVIIKGNTGKLHQVFLNVLSNAIDSFEKDGQIIIKTYIEKNSVNIDITDNGKGIDKEILNRITDPFFTTKAPGEGTGLGLYISLEIIKKHKGQLKIESSKESGTKVSIIIPL